MSNSGPMSDTTGNIAIASARLSTSFLPRNWRRAIAYAASVARITDSTVAMIEMPNELISARWKSSFWSTLLKLSQVHSFGRNWGLPAAVSACGLNDSMIIHTTGSRHHTRSRTPPMMTPGLSRCRISPPSSRPPGQPGRASPG